MIVAAAFLLAFAGAPPVPDESRRREAALWSALGLAITPRLLMFGRRIFIDIYISIYMALTLVFFALAERYPERRRLFLAWMYVAIGLGVLTKGPIAILLPGLVFAAYLLMHRELGRIRTMMLPLGTLIVAAIVVPWYAALYVRDGWEPIESFIVGENVARYTEGLGVDAYAALWFYVPVIFSDSFPWSFVPVRGGRVMARGTEDWRTGRRPVEARPHSAVALDHLHRRCSSRHRPPSRISISFRSFRRSRRSPASSSRTGFVDAVPAFAGRPQSSASSSRSREPAVLYLVGSPTGIYVVEGAPDRWGGGASSAGSASR